MEIGAAACCSISIDPHFTIHFWIAEVYTIHIWIFQNHRGKKIGPISNDAINHITSNSNRHRITSPPSSSSPSSLSQPFEQLPIKSYFGYDMHSRFLICISLFLSLSISLCSGFLTLVCLVIYGRKSLKNSFILFVNKPSTGNSVCVYCIQMQF